MNWLPDMDLNHDKQIQSLLCYRYTIGQAGAFRSVNLSPLESSCRSVFKSLVALFAILAFAIAMNAAEEKSKAGTLLVYFLSVESSYAQNVERPATNQFDTLQWWVGEGGNWRLKTYAIDADIHPHKLETGAPHSKVIQLAKDNTKKHYGDVIKRIVEVDVPAGLSKEELGKFLKKQGLSENFEWVPAGYLFWKPDARDYNSKTKPK